MGKASQSLEKRRLREVVREYEELGYEVRVAPRASDLPEFLREFERELIAYNGHEGVVVESSRVRRWQGAKTSPGSLRRSRTSPDGVSNWWLRIRRRRSLG